MNRPSDAVHGVLLCLGAVALTAALWALAITFSPKQADPAEEHTGTVVSKETVTIDHGVTLVPVGKGGLMPIDGGTSTCHRLHLVNPDNGYRYEQCVPEQVYDHAAAQDTWTFRGVGDRKDTGTLTKHDGTGYIRVGD